MSECDVVRCPICGEEMWWPESYEYDNMPCDDCRDTSDIWEYGALHHTADNKWWNISKEEHLTAALRHISRDVDGEKYDEDSGYKHLDHARTRLEMAKFCGMVKKNAEEK